jgi:hypothetical protein
MYGRFGTTYRSFIQVPGSPYLEFLTLPLKLGLIGCPETSIQNYHSNACPKVSILQVPFLIILHFAVTALRCGQHNSRGSIPVRNKKSISYPKRPNRRWDPPSPLCCGKLDLIRREQSGFYMRLTAFYPLMPSLRMRGYTLYSLIPSGGYLNPLKTKRICFI